jgi:hypothetical protein
MHGQKYTMADVQKMVTEDPNMHNLTCEQKKEFIKQLMDHRELQTSGIPASNVAAAQDAVTVMDGVSKEVSICQSSNFTVYLRFYSFMRYVTELASMPLSSWFADTSTIKSSQHGLQLTMLQSFGRIRWR